MFDRWRPKPQGHCASSSYGCGDQGRLQVRSYHRNATRIRETGKHARVRQQIASSIGEEEDDWKVVADPLIEKGVVLSLSAKSCDVDDSSSIACSTGVSGGGWRACKCGRTTEHSMSLRASKV